jgi:predicted nucleotidyltransferase
MDLERRKIAGKVVRAAREAEDILAVILFGSSARGENSSTSDLDLCLVLMPNSYLGLELSKIKLKYASQFTAHISIFQQLPLYMKKRVLQEGKILLCRDYDALYELAFKTLREYSHFAPIYREYLKEVAHAG